MNGNSLDSDGKSGEIHEIIRFLWDIFHKAANNLNYLQDDNLKLRLKSYDLEKQIQSFEGFITGKEQEVAEYEARILEYEKKFDSLKDYDWQIINLNNENSELIRKLEIISSESEKLSEMLTQSRSMLEISSDYEEENRQLREKCQYLENIISELNIRLDYLTELETNIEFAQKEIVRKNHDLNSLAEEIISYREQISSMQSMILKLENNNSLRQLEIEELNETINSRNNELAEVSTKQDEIESLNVYVSELNREIADAKNSILLKDKKIEELYLAKEEKESELNEKCIQLNVLTSEIVQLKQITGEFESINNSFKEQLKQKDERSLLQDSTLDKQEEYIKNIEMKLKESEIRFNDISQKSAMLENENIRNRDALAEQSRILSRHDELKINYQKVSDEKNKILSELDTVLNDKEKMKIKLEGLDFDLKAKNELLTLFEKRINSLDSESKLQLTRKLDEYIEKIDKIMNN